VTLVLRDADVARLLSAEDSFRVTEAELELKMLKRVKFKCVKIKFIDC
jgi:hypothetical protein